MKKKCILVPRFDTYGDILLILPLVRALVSREYKVLLLVRTGYQDIFDIIDTANISLRHIATDPYCMPSSNEFDRVATEIKSLTNQFEIDEVCISTFNLTWIDQLVAHIIPSSVTTFLKYQQDDAWFSTRLIWSGIPAIQGKHRDINCDEKIRESIKYEILASFLNVTIEYPLITMEHQPSNNLSLFLKENRLMEKQFITVNPAGNQNVAHKKWQDENYFFCLKRLHQTLGFQIVMVVHESEVFSIRHLMHMLEEARIPFFIWAGTRGGWKDLNSLLKISAGYFGNDTATIHLAALIGIPVFGIFGGGHWPRFIPPAMTGSIFYISVSCTYCQWKCPYEVAYCIAKLPAKQIADTMVNFFSNNLSTFEVRDLSDEIEEYKKIISQQSNSSLEIQKDLPQMTGERDGETMSFSLDIFTEERVRFEIYPSIPCKDVRYFVSNFPQTKLISKIRIIGLDSRNQMSLTQLDQNSWDIWTPGTNTKKMINTKNWYELTLDLGSYVALVAIELIFNESTA